MCKNIHAHLRTRYYERVLFGCTWCPAPMLHRALTAPPPPPQQNDPYPLLLGETWNITGTSANEMHLMCILWWYVCVCVCVCNITHRWHTGTGPCLPVGPVPQLHPFPRRCDRERWGCCPSDQTGPWVGCSTSFGTTVV